MRRLVVLPVLATAALAAGCGFSLQNAAGLSGAEGPVYRVTAEFPDAAGLPVGGTVRIGQATVGRVAEIRTEDYHAIVELDIQSDVELPASTRARLELTSALGEEFVALEPPRRREGPTLEERPAIPLERTSRGPDVESTLAVVGTLLSGSGIDQVRTIVTEANTMLGGRAGKVRGLLSELDTVLGSLDARSGELISVIDSMHALSGQLADSRPTLEAALTEIRPAVRALLAERERFTALLGNVASLGTAAQGLLDETGSAFTGQLAELRPVLDNLASVEGRLGPTLTSLQNFAVLLQDATPGDYLMLDGTLEVPLTIAEILNPDFGGASQPVVGDLRALLEGGAR
ncbi:MCE family protein [Prauserella flavalba]|uniref:MCE family protein n=1 Tax=Prauserella flavalba TaxID=1477506 RepID=UPI0036ED66DE